jgi:RNA polymerase primary sigma factor
MNQLRPICDISLMEKNCPPQEQRSADADGEPVSGDVIRYYLNSIKGTPVLTREEETEHAKRIEAGVFASDILDQVTANAGVIPPQLAGRVSYEDLGDLQEIAKEGRAAYDSMLRHNLRLVVSIAKRYPPAGILSFADYIQDGNLALHRAIVKFDHTKGFKFSTYATRWIKQFISRSMNNQGRTIRVPEDLGWKISAIERAYWDYLKLCSNEPTIDEMVEITGETAAAVEEAFVIIYQRPISLSTLVGEGDDELGNFVEDPEALFVEDVLNDIDRAPLIEAIRGHYDMLSEDEKLVIQHRFGLDQAEQLTDAEIGKKLKVSRQRATKIGESAMRKLRENAYNDKTLVDAMSS